MALWTAGKVSRAAIMKKWLHGPDVAAAAPLVGVVAAACSFGVFACTRHLTSNPSVVVSKARREEDVTASARRDTREGQAFVHHAAREYLRDRYNKGEQGTLDNSTPFLLTSMYPKHK